ALGLIYLLVDLYHIHRRVIAVELAIALHRPPTGVVEGYAGGAQPVADLVEVVDLDREVAVDDRMQPQVVVPRQRLRRLADVNLATVVVLEERDEVRAGLQHPSPLGREWERDL